MHIARIATFLRIFLRKTHGQDLIEYGILLGICTAVTVIALNQIGGKTANFFGSAITKIQSNNAAQGSPGVAGGGDNSGGGNGSGNGGGSGSGSGSGNGNGNGSGGNNNGNGNNGNGNGSGGNNNGSGNGPGNN